MVVKTLSIGGVVMRVSHSLLITLKRDLVSARATLKETASAARRDGEDDLANRLCSLAQHLAFQLDDLEQRIENCARATFQRSVVSRVSRNISTPQQQAPKTVSFALWSA
jgi:hypothetical protein